MGTQAAKCSTQVVWYGMKMPYSALLWKFEMIREKGDYAWHPFYVVGQGTVERYMLLASGIVVPHDNDGGQLQSSTPTLT